MVRGCMVQLALPSFHLAKIHVTDMVSSCVVQYSMLEYQKLFWLVSNLYLYHTYHVR